MKNVRCRCGKIVCQADGYAGPGVGKNTVQEDVILIKCRHCKRLIAIHTKGVTKVEYFESELEAESRLSS